LHLKKGFKDSRSQGFKEENKGKRKMEKGK